LKCIIFAINDTEYKDLLDFSSLLKDH
jgi:hypothetical protein